MREQLGSPASLSLSLQRRSVCPGRSHARALRHAIASFFAAPSSSPCLRFGSSVAMRCAIRLTSQAQSGCLSCGSQHTPTRRQSATRQRPVGCPSVGGQRADMALPRPACIGQNLWKSNQGSKAMPWPSIIAKSHKACLFSPALASATSLTGRSSGRQHWPWLRHFHGQCRYPTHLRCSGAAYLER
jgi:hypothetical protein